MSPSVTMQLAEIAMGSSARLMEDFQFKNRFGWAPYWRPDDEIARCARLDCVRSLIWC